MRGLDDEPLVVSGELSSADGPGSSDESDGVRGLGMAGEVTAPGSGDEADVGDEGRDPVLFSAAGAEEPSAAVAPPSAESSSAFLLAASALRAWDLVFARMDREEKMICVCQCHCRWKNLNRC